jgi:hypothetical protein
MLITEHIEAQRRKMRIANLTFAALTVLTACAVEFLPLPSGFDDRTRALVFAAAFLLASVAGSWRTRRALRCPRCHGSLLRPLLTVNGPARRCPLCSADFSELMPGN